MTELEIPVIAVEPWPGFKAPDYLREGEAEVTCRRFSEPLEPRVECVWSGPLDGLVPVHREFDGMHRMPWPLELVGPHPMIPNCDYYRRTDV